MFERKKDFYFLLIFIFMNNLGFSKNFKQEKTENFLSLEQEKKIFENENTETVKNNKIEKAPVLKKQSNSKVAIRNNKIVKTPIVKTQGNNKVRNV